MPRQLTNLLGTTYCKECGVFITLENAVYNNRYLKSICRDCRNIGQKIYEQENDVVHKRKLRQFNISNIEYNNKKAIQLNGCAICKQPCATGRKLAIDHDHQTDVIRDLLCFKCNAILGLVNDNEDYLWNILDYIKRHGLKHAV